MGLFKKKMIKEVEFYSPLSGKLIPLSEVKDEAFSSGVLGKGFAILPSQNILYMPVDGTITMIFPTKHAIGFKDALGNEYLIHIGIDTVNLNGNGFQCFVELEQFVKAGEKLMEYPLNAIIKAGYDPSVMIIDVNLEHEAIALQEHKNVEAMEKLVNICRETI